MKCMLLAFCFGMVLIVGANSSLALPSDTDPIAQTTSPTEHNTREALEINKLREEIGKLQIDRTMAYIAPLASLGSIFMLAVALIVQRKTSLNIQERAERTNFELKIADLVMTSYSPSAAQNRLSLLTALYKDRIRPNFAAAFNADQFPGLRKHEMLMELFGQMAGKCKTENEVVEVFRQVFPNERAWWFDAQFPPSVSGALPAKQDANIPKQNS